MNSNLPSFIPPHRPPSTAADADLTPLYRLAFQASPDCLALLAAGDDGQLRFADVNPAWERLAGLPRSELLGRTPSERLAAAMADAIVEAGRACLAAEAPLDSEFNVAMPAGQHHFWSRLAPLGGPHEANRHVLVTLRDISVSKRYEQQLLTDQQAFRALAEHTPDTIARYDRQCVRRYANPAFARLARLPAASLLGKKPSHSSRASAMLGYEAKLKAVVASGVAAEYDLTWKAANGRLVVSHILIVPERGNAGEVISVLAVGRDITAQRQAQEQLRLREQEFRTLVENSPDVIVRFNREGQRIYCNPAYERLYGLARQTVLGSTVSQKSALPAELRTRYQEKLQDIFRSGSAATIESVWTNDKGDEVVQHVRAVPEVDEGGRVVSVLAVARDISALKETERRLKDAEALAHLGHWQLDYRLGRFILSAELCRLLGKPRSWSPRPQEVFSMLVHEDRQRISRAINQAHRQRTEALVLDYQIETELRRMDLHSRLRIRYAADGTPLQLLGTAQDVSELKAYQQKLHMQAFYDGLTQLPNRELLNKRLLRAIDQARQNHSRVAVILLDIDNFKQINDNLGRASGDELLREAARRLLSTLRQDDTVARLGGDEFVLVLPDLAPETELGEFADKLLEALSRPFRIGNRDLFVSGSFGVAYFPDDGDDIAKLLRFADAAMYHAKEQGKNNVQFYTPLLTRQTAERLELATNLRQARERGELELYFQPQVDLTSTKLLGAEALLRWKHPEYGYVPPDRFIPIAEETGLIIDIGDWVLRTACCCAAAWNRDTLHPLKIAINLSPRQFKQNDLLASLCAILTTTGCEPGWLALEITEGLLLENNAAVRDTLQQLNAMGISIAIDDFGTGYSALGYLKRFPVDILKIDRSFIHDVEHNSESAELVKAIISMAHALNLELVAEGVENCAQEQFLKHHGCQSAQGFFYSAPVSQSAFELFLVAQKRIVPS